MNSVAITDTGRERTTNQDYVFCSDTPIGYLPNLYIVADGMGGHKAGDLASRYTVDVFINHVKNFKLKDPVSIIEESLKEANSALIQKASESTEYEGMGTTIVIATILENVLYVANVGDSRLYIINDEVIQVTRDHSLVEEMAALGGLDKESARAHVNKNIITRAVGVDLNLKADYFEVEMTRRDTVLLCSDGLTNMIDDESIKEIVHKEEEISAAAAKLIETANTNGGRDNISVVLIVQNLK